MKVSTTKQKTITLTEDEEHWLKSVMQNPLFNQNPDDEPEPERTYRRDLFESLDWVTFDNRDGVDRK